MNVSRDTSTSSKLIHREPSPSAIVMMAGLALLVMVVMVGSVLAPRLNSSSALSSRHRHGTESSKPVEMSECISLLKQAVPNNPVLVNSVSTLLRDAKSNGSIPGKFDPSMIVVTYRRHENEISDVVVQLYHTPLDGRISVLNEEGVVRTRLGDDLYQSADQLLGMIYHQVSYLGEPAEIARVQRAFQSSIRGDLTLLREQTVDPLYVVVLMPRAKAFLPGSMRTRVNSVVMNAELGFGEWQGKVGFVTDNKESAEQVGNTVAAWREMAVSLADTFASYSSGQPLRESLRDSSVEVDGNIVLTSAAVPAKTVVRATKEVAGHGGAQGCTIGFYHKADHWPSGVTQLTLGCKSYSKTECINIIGLPSGGDASLILIQQLIAAKLNVIVGLPSAPLATIADADAVLCLYSGKVPYNVAPSSTNGQRMVADGAILDTYNNSCH